MLLTGIISSYSLLFLTTLYFSVMPNLNEYYQLLQNEEPPLSNDALREMIASAVERADKEALAAPQATESARRSRLNGTGMVIGSAAIIALTFWGFNYFQSQQSSAPQVHREAVQGEKSEVGTTGITTTTQESTSRSLDTEYNTQQTNQFLQPPFADIGHKARPQTKDDITATTADTLTKNTTAQTAVLPADSLLPEDFRSWEMPSYLAWAVAERRYNDALGILDSLLLRKQALPNTKFNLLCLRGHLHKIMASVNASIADYSSALDMHESSELYMLRGIQYRTASQHQEALQDFTNAIRLNPYNAQAVLMRGTTAHKLGRLQEACSDWLAAAEMGNTVADSLLKAKCNPTVIQTIRTAQAKRSQDIKTLALLIERTKESIDKTPSPNSSAQSLTIESLIRKIFSSTCDIPTVLKGEASAYCAFQALHTIALELQDDSLANLVKPALERKTTYSSSSVAQRAESYPAVPSGVTEIVSVLDQKVLATMNGGTVRTSGIDPALTNSRSNTTRSRNSNRMGGNNSIAQYQTLPPEILRNVLKTIENYCRATYPEMVAQAPSSVKTETKVQPLPPSAQQDTARTSQTAMSTTDSRTAMAEVEKNVANTVLLLNTLQNKLQSARRNFPQTPMPQLDSLSYRAFGNTCNTNNVTDSTISPFCMVHLLYSFALELHDPVAIDFTRKIWKRMNTAVFPLSKIKNRPNTYYRTDNTNYNEIITRQVANGASADQISSLQSKQAMQSAIRTTQEMDYPSDDVSSADIQGIVQLLQQMKKYCRVTYPEMPVQAPSSVETETKVQPLPAQQDTARTSQTAMSTPDSRKDEATTMAPSAPQTTQKSTITAAAPTEKPSWQYGKRIYQQQYSLLDQLTQIALSQVGVKTTFSQLLAPCTLSAALAGKSSNDCVLSLLEQQAVQIQDSTLQAYAILAQRYRNYQMPSTPKAPEPIAPTDTYKSIPVSTLPRTLESARNPVHEELLVVRVMEEMPKSTSEPTKPNDASVHLYRQVLLNIQKHTWKVIDAIEDTTVSRQNTERESNVTKDFGDMPLWFQELVQTRRFAFAQNLIDSMLTQESRATELYTLRGDMSKSMDSVATSIADYTQALSLQESSELYMRRGTQYFTADKRQEAYDDFANAVRLEPRNYQAVFMRGAAAYNLKRFEEACDDWYLAAQMGHPFADSVLEQRCASVMPKYVRTAIAEKKQQVKIMLLLLEQINSRGISWNTQKLDSLSYKSLEVNCTMENALGGSISSACALHLLYTMALNLHDDIASDFVKRLAERAQRFAISSPDATASPNFDQTMRSIDYNKQIVDMVSNINSTPRGDERVQSLQNLQRLQSQAMNRRTENTFRNATPQSSRGQLAGIVEQMKKYLLEQYAEFIDAK